MDNHFQDKIDEFLLHGDSMTEEEKANFMNEKDGDAEKKEQFEFTQAVKKAMVSRGEKLKAMEKFQKNLNKHRRRKIVLWTSSIAAVMVVGFVVVDMFHMNETPMPDGVRGDNEVFEKPIPTDSVSNDTVTFDSTTLHHE